MTPACHQKLSEEYDRLRNIERPKTTEIIQWAAGNGDRSENADYIYGKRRLREIDSRLRFLGKRLGDAVVVDPETVKSDLIKFGATVLVEDSGVQRTYYIVGQDEIELEKSKVSWKSPIGKSLLGKEEGDIIEVKTPNGIKELEVIEISYQKIP
ncbi:MAG: transcription elongation factor GreB [Bacteriovoracaceae bacterium]|nr:transcription elongation factor GreB [Bacteriovoracaceae bacterium]